MLLGYVWAQPTNREETLAVEAAGCERIVVETGFASGAESPVLNAMLGRLAADDVLVVWRLDRLAGSLSGLVAMVDRLASRGIGVRSISENFSTVEASPPPMAWLFRLLAEFDQRSREHDAARHRAQRKTGRPRALTPVDVERARMLIQESGRSIDDVARELGVSRATLYRYLERQR